MGVNIENQQSLVHFDLLVGVVMEDEDLLQKMEII